MFGLRLLLPLDTLPGWPAAPDPNAFQTLWVLLGAPGVIAAVITVLCLAPNWFERNRPTPTEEIQK